MITRSSGWMRSLRSKSISLTAGRRWEESASRVCLHLPPPLEMRSSMLRAPASGVFRSLRTGPWRRSKTRKRRNRRIAEDGEKKSFDLFKGAMPPAHLLPGLQPGEWVICDLNAQNQLNHLINECSMCYKKYPDADHSTAPDSS